MKLKHKPHRSDTTVVTWLATCDQTWAHEHETREEAEKTIEEMVNEGSTNIMLIKKTLEAVKIK